MHVTSNSLEASPDFRSLVAHSGSIQGAENLGVAYTCFNHCPHDFMAVFDEDALVGVISRREVSMILGSRFGWELFSRDRVRDHLEPKCIVIREDSPLIEVLSTVFSEQEQFFFDDVVLLDRNGHFLGLITFLTMIRLQHRYLLDNIAMLEQKQRELRQKNRQNEEDLALARELQMALLPQKSLFDPAGAGNLNHLRFFYHYEPASTVGGDFCIIQQVTPEWWGVLLCDVMGHGVRSALVTTMIRALFEELHSVAANPGELLTGLNKDLTRLFNQSSDGIFVTALYMIISADGEIRYAKAGHHDPVLVDRERRTSLALSSPRETWGAALGIIDDAAYTTISLSVDAGSMIILFTDGLFEIEDQDRNPLGYDHLLTLINRHCAGAPDNLARALIDDIAHLTGCSTFDDDICLVGIVIPHSPERPRLHFDNQ